jgi:hypothetical protein
MLLTSLLFALGTAAVPTLGGPPLKRGTDGIYPSAAQFAIYTDDNYCSGNQEAYNIPDGYCYSFPIVDNNKSLYINYLAGDCQSKT